MRGENLFLLRYIRVLRVVRLFRSLVLPAQKPSFLPANMSGIYRRYDNTRVNTKHTRIILVLYGTYTHVIRRWRGPAQPSSAQLSPHYIFNLDARVSTALRSRFANRITTRICAHMGTFTCGMWCTSTCDLYGGTYSYMYEYIW